MAEGREAGSAPSVGTEQVELQDRVSRIIALAQAARSGGNAFDLEAARIALDGVSLSSSEVAVVQSFVQGDLIEAQTRQLLQAAQSEPDAGKVIAKAQEDKVITPDQTAKMIQAVAGQASKPAETLIPEVVAPQVQQPVAEEVPAIAGRINPANFATGTTSPDGVEKTVPRGPLKIAG